MKLMIQIPCYNEAETLEITLNALHGQLDGMLDESVADGRNMIDEIEYLIVDDGSNDDTVQVARNCGVHHIVSQKCNKGLARGFMAGLDGCLRNGADIIVNTDADNQYCAEDIRGLIGPILEGRADIVIGARPIDDTEHFSFLKKKLQHFGSFVVRRASNTDIPDAPSGFRAFSREAAMRINVINDYTYTLETIVQAGRERMAITSVPVHTNGALRPSRLFSNTWEYVKKSMLTILRAYMMYRPLKCFSFLAAVPTAAGLLIGFRYLYLIAAGTAGGHVQSLILGCTLIIIGFLTLVIGLLADVLAANRKILQDAQYHARRAEYDSISRIKETGQEGDGNGTGRFREEKAAGDSFHFSKMEGRYGTGVYSGSGRPYDRSV